MVKKDFDMEAENIIGFAKPEKPIGKTGDLEFHPSYIDKTDPRLSRPSPKKWFRRHMRLLSLLACAALPTLTVAGYEYGFASDQYVSEFEFVVHQQSPQSSQPASLLSALGGGNPMLAAIEDSEVVVQYIQSHQILTDLKNIISIDGIYARPDADWLSRVKPGLPEEKQLKYWRHMVQPYFDFSSGVITVKVNAFTPQDAQMVANAVKESSEALVNQMSLQARQNALTYAEQSADDAQTRLLADEKNLADYRNRYRVLFPEMSAASTTSIGESLSSQLAGDEANLASLLSLGQTGASPQIQTLRARIAAAQTQIDRVDAALATGNAGKAVTLATVLSGYDSLTETEKLDAKLYESGLVALQTAREIASQKSIYLETFVQPNFPESSVYPVRWLVTAETMLAGFVAWVILILITNIIRDQVD